MQKTPSKSKASEGAITASELARSVGWPSLMVLAAAAPGLLLMGRVMRQVASLHAASLPQNPYWDPSNFLLLYVLLPFVFAGTVTMLLAPGFLLFVGAMRRVSFAVAVTRGFLVTFVLTAIVAAAAKRLFVDPSRPFAIGLIGMAAATWLWCFRRNGAIVNPRAALRRLLWLVGLPALAVAVLLPVFFWQDLNPDGIEMLWMARSLDHHLIPRLASGDLSGLGLGMVAEIYPSQFFYLLGGMTESVVRLPMLLYLPLLFLAVIGAIETGGDRRLHAADEALLAFGVCSIVVGLIYNATYHAYSADAASPAAIDVLAAICLLGMLTAFAEDRRGWFLAFLGVGYFARPIGLLICGLLLVAHLLIDRRNWRVRIPTLVMGIGLCMVLALLYEKGLATWLGVGLEEPSTGVTGRRLRYVLFADWRRLACVLVPIGFVPAVALIRLRLQDGVARVWTAVTLMFLVFFWFPAYFALHHFLPATLLALLVFWRVVAGRERRFVWRGAALASAFAAMWMSLPRSFAVDRSIRAIGAQVDYRIGDLLGGPDGFRTAFEGRHLLEPLFGTYKERNPDRVFMGAPLAFIHYSAVSVRSKAEPNYLVLPPGKDAEAPWSRIATDSTGSVWVRDRTLWQDQLSHPPPTDFRSPWLAIPREALLPAWGVPAKRYDLDLSDLLSRFRSRQH